MFVSSCCLQAEKHKLTFWKNIHEVRGKSFCLSVDVTMQTERQWSHFQLILKSQWCHLCSSCFTFSYLFCCTFVQHCHPLPSVFVQGNNTGIYATPHRNGIYSHKEINVEASYSNTVENVQIEKKKLRRPQNKFHCSFTCGLDCSRLFCFYIGKANVAGVWDMLIVTGLINCS